MKPTKKIRHTIAVLTIAVLGLMLVSWKQKQAREMSEISTIDTIPKKDRPIIDLDQAIAELESIDISREIEKAVQEMETALKQLDFQAMSLDIQRDMDKINFEKIEAQLQEAMAEIQHQDIELQVKQSIAKMDWEKIKEELQKVKEIDLRDVEENMIKAKEEIKKVKPQMERELEKARVEIDKAKAELKEYKTFLEGLDSDGLINKKEDYIITHEENKLIINGKGVSSAVYEKYRKFLDSHQQFTIKKEKGDFNIDLD